MPTGVLTAVAVAGLGLSAFGASQSYSAARSQATAQQGMIAEQQKQEALRQQAMELDARRRQREILRNQQRARSMSLTTATAQGASFGSVLPGAFGQISGQAGTQGLGVSQNLEIGRGMFASNMVESQYKMDYAAAGAQMAFGQGLSTLGGAIVSNLGTIGNLSGNAFGGSNTFGQAAGYAMYGSNPFTSSGGINPYYSGTR